MNLVRHTTSFCGVCYREIPATVVTERSGAVMRKRCHAHGEQIAEVEVDPLFYTYIQGLGRNSIYSGYFVDVTRRCDLRCTYCYYALEKQDPEGEYAIQRIVEDCKVNRQHTPFIITGGEPTTRKDILDVLDAVRQVGPTVMLSNGVTMAKDEALFTGVMQRLWNPKDGISHLNLSIHDDQTEAWRVVLERCRKRKMKIESALIVVDSKERFQWAVSTAREFTDVVVSFRIKSATRIWNETKPQGRIFVSDMLGWLEEMGGYQFIMPGHNQTTFVNVLHSGMWLMLVSWYDVTNVDLEEINCGPYYRAKSGEVCNLVKWGLINEGMAKGWLAGQKIADLKAPT